MIGITSMRRLERAVLVIGLYVVLFVAVADTKAAWFRKDPPRPGRTTLDSVSVTMPAQVVSDYIIISAKWDRKGPYNFLIDTGASVSLVSPSMAQRYGTIVRQMDGSRSQVSVKSSEGETTVLDAVSIKRIDLGDARFENVPALIYDCNAISVHLGIRVDGILGFPFFREVLLTLDYPRHQVILTQPGSASALLPGTVVGFNNDQRTPIIPLRVTDQTFYALIDSGSDSTLRINPIGLNIEYAQAPRAGPVVSSLTGDRQQIVARLKQPIMIGDQTLEKPIVEITDELPAIGGGILKNFAVTFDQEHSRVVFYREKHTPLEFPPKRGPGMSVTKAGAYWRVVGVVPGSPAAKAGIAEGDIITRINQEPVEQWGTARFGALVEQSEFISFTFLVGARENDVKLGVMDIVP